MITNLRIVPVFRLIVEDVEIGISMGLAVKIRGSRRRSDRIRVTQGL